MRGLYSIGHWNVHDEQPGDRCSYLSELCVCFRTQLRSGGMIATRPPKTLEDFPMKSYCGSKDKVFVYGVECLPCFLDRPPV